MATLASIGHGTLFKRGDGASPTEAFATVGEVNSPLGFDMSKDTIDATHTESPNRYREFISGLRDGGEIEVGVNFIPEGTAMTNALTDFNANVARNYRIDWADGTTFLFAGIMTGPAVESPLDDKMTATFTYKVTGQPTYTAGA